MNEITVQVQYFAMLGAQRGTQTETVRTTARTAQDLFDELKRTHGFRLPGNICKVSINDEIQTWYSELRDGDSVALLPPFSGG